MKTLSLSPFLLPSPQLAPSNELITAAAAANLGKPQTTTTKTNYPNYGVAGCVACERRRAGAGGFVAGPDFRAGAHSPFNTLFVTPFTRPPLHADEQRMYYRAQRNKAGKLGWNRVPVVEELGARQKDRGRAILSHLARNYGPIWFGLGGDLASKLCTSLQSSSSLSHLAFLRLLHCLSGLPAE